MLAMHLEHIEGLSAHGDQNDLIDWVSDIKEQPEKIFIVHGETEQANALSEALLKQKGWQAQIARMNQIVEL